MEGEAPVAVKMVYFRACLVFSHKSLNFTEVWKLSRFDNQYIIYICLTKITNSKGGGRIWEIHENEDLDEIEMPKIL